MTVLDDFPVLTGDDVISVGTDTFLVRPKNQMRPLIKGISQDMANSGTSPVIIVFFAFRVGLYMGDGDFFFHQLFRNPHTSQSVKGIIINFTDNRRCFGVNNKMSLVLRVTHQPQRRCPSAEFPLPGTGHAPRQNLFGNIPAIHVVQDVLKGRDVHFLTGQAVHTICDGDIPDIVPGEEDFNIASGFDIVSSQSGQVFRDHTTDFPCLNVSNHALERGAVEIAACVTVIHIISYWNIPFFSAKSRSMSFWLLMLILSLSPPSSREMRQ